ncbi:MAG: hypothetical protein ATN35_09060 [Epulopiscium sp. Nele67-Bin004]|nr:MAG: hypothetical protein ATN35_09060 [Epulopiscium sp. Nele67-Bin004]
MKFVVDNIANIISSYIEFKEQAGFYIWGSSEQSQLLWFIIEGQFSESSLLGFIDDKKQGQMDKRFNLPIYSYEQVKAQSDIVFIILDIYEEEAKQFINENYVLVDSKIFEENRAKFKIDVDKLLKFVGGNKDKRYYLCISEYIQKTICELIENNGGGGEDLLI